MSSVFVVMVDDRHDDPEPHLFSTETAALEFAREEVAHLARHGAEVEEVDVDGWLYHAGVGDEGDSVWVVEKRVDDPEWSAA